MTAWVLGLDPGKTGGIAALSADGELDTLAFAKATEADLSDWIEEFAPLVRMALVEKVHSSPQMGVKSAFSFGQSYGLLRGLLTAHKIPWDTVTPQTWQRKLSCLTKGDKRVTKAKAQQLYPRHGRITHGIADSILIAHYAASHYGR